MYDNDNDNINNDEIIPIIGSSPRIGVFVCDCGTNIAGVVNVSDVTEFARSLTDVVFAEEGKWICAVDYLTKIKEHIAEYNLDRVVVACCTPRTHEPTFKATLKEAGLNPYLLEFVSIREQSSWVHKDDPILATETAKDLVHMGVAKARFLEPGEEMRIPVGSESLIIGGGIAGMTAALALGDLGFNVKLVERSNELGGLVSKLYKIAPEDILASELIRLKIERIDNHSNIDVYVNTELSEITGYVGNFQVKLRNCSKTENSSENIIIEDLNISTIIVATGMQEIIPHGLFGYGKYPNVITQLQFEEMLKNNDPQLSQIKEIAFINCVNSRNNEHGCCNIGCLTSIKNLKAVNQINPGLNSYLFFRDFALTGMDVQYHYNSMDKYSIAFRYRDNSPPTVTNSNIKFESNNELNKSKLNENPRLDIQVFDILTGEQVKVNVDLVVLAAGYKGDDSAQHLKGLLKVSTNSDDFFLEAHVKLRPLDFANEGIYVCGCARSPKDIHDTMEESIGAAMRAAIPMKKSFVETEGIVAKIDDTACINCSICSEACAFGAIEFSNNEPMLIEAICKGCGTCAAGCPGEAIDIVHFSTEQILAQVKAALAEKSEEKIIVFACHWCALGAVDNAGVSRFEYPATLRIIRVMCSGRVDPEFILHSFEHGAAGVLVAGCEFPTCHYISGNYYASKKVQLTKELLKLAGFNSKRLRLEWLSAAQGSKFAQVATEFTDELTELGPLSVDDVSDIALQAIIRCAKSDRIRILASKLKDFVETGNVYGEVFTDHEVDRIINLITYDEFIKQQVMILLNNSDKSIKMMSDDLGLSLQLIFKCVSDLIRSGKVQAISPSDNPILYRIVAKDSELEPSSELEPYPIVKNNSSLTEPEVNIHKFDYMITGSNMDALKKAMELSDQNNKVCLITNQASFYPGPTILDENFSSYSNFLNEYCSLIDNIHQNENITVIKNAGIEKVSSENNNKLELKVNATFVQEDKCNNCGKCLDVCPVNILDHDTFGILNKHAIYQPWPKCDSTKYAISKAVPYCQSSCPIMMDTRGYISSIASMEIDLAYNKIRNTNPLPDLCGKICNHACETTCARGFLDEPLEIRKLKGFTTKTKYDFYEKNNKQLLEKPTITKNNDPSNKVAIIGSGPAGLAAAHDLAMMGYPVTIFESAGVVGGMLRMGIPDFRLPPEDLEREIQGIIGLGVELKLNTPIGVNLTLSKLKNKGYRAIFIGVGAQKCYDLGITGEDLNGVVNGLELLKNINMGNAIESPTSGSHVVVVGGGNVAIDCARSVRRLGVDKITIVYRRTEQEMPADIEEIVQSREEGIEFQFLVAPKEIIGDSGKVNSIRCQRTKLGPMDASGRRRPIIVDGTDFTIETDCVISAIGQAPDLDFIASEDNEYSLEITSKSNIVVNNKTGETNVAGIFAGGDVVTGPATVISAINGGKLAAKAIDHYLSDDEYANNNLDTVNGEIRGIELEMIRLRKNHLNLLKEPKRYRETKKLLDAVTRISSFTEVEEPLTFDEAVSESKRCLSCRICIGCGVCQAVCPQNAISYNDQDQWLMIEAKQILKYPHVVEGRFLKNIQLKELYSNSLNVLTSMEFEFVQNSTNQFSGQILRQSDGEIAKKLCFINLPEKEFNNDTESQMNDLELVYISKLIEEIHKRFPEIEITLVTNSTEIHQMPDRFQYLLESTFSIEEKIDFVDLILIKDGSNKFQLTEDQKDLTFDFEFRDKKKKFDLIIINSGLYFDQ